MRFSLKASAGQSDGSPTGFEIWGQRGSPTVGVAGESHHAKEIRALLPAALGAEGAEVRVKVSLLHDPHNKYDPNAVEVRAANGLVGYLSRQDAARYAPAIRSMQQSGLTPVTTARVWGCDDRGRGSQTDGFFGSVQIDLPEPHMMAPRNEAPIGPFRLLPSGNAIQVAGEEHHREAFEPFMNNDGECWAFATLEVIPPEKPGQKPCAEVRLSGQVAGQLSPRMSAELLPAIEFLRQRGEATAARAKVVGNQLKFEITIHAARAHELKSDWFDDLDATPEAPSATAEPARTSTPVPPADWYPDPHRVARLRYWDGQRWTEHVAP